MSDAHLIYSRDDFWARAAFEESRRLVEPDDPSGILELGFAKVLEGLLRDDPRPVIR